MSNPVLTFDRYRDLYDQLSFADQRKFYDSVAREFPDQIGFSLPHAAEFFRHVQPQSVVELGGWDGRMAHFLGVGMQWTNYELADVPQSCGHEGYRVVLDRWIWDEPIDAGVFVASHSLEHLSLEHLKLLLGALHTEWAYVEVPLEMHPTDWHGYFGSHVLPLSIWQFDTLWRDDGWEIAYSTMLTTGFLRWYRR